MFEIHAQYNWMFPVHVLLFHTVSIYVYGLMPVQNKGMHAFSVPAHFLFMDDATPLTACSSPAHNGERRFHHL
jgi:hypothetical protein